MRAFFPKSAFTLIELSIVLVIIGLIIGGILVGKDMIHTAELRRVVSQVQSYNTAENTFRLKYNAMPGDMLASDAAALGFVTRAGGAGHGNNDQMLQDADGGTGSQEACGETVLFWNDLATANQIPDLTTASADAAAVNCLPVSGAALSGWIPQARLRNNLYIIINDVLGYHYYKIAAVLQISMSGLVSTVANASLAPDEALYIDTKLDDGVPNTGTVIPVGTIANLIAGTPTGSLVSGSCWDSTLGIYGTDSPLSAGGFGCMLRIRAGFN
jgi:prepilin-type N-terminal cleavage/methylation domain-containing protein